MRHHNAKRKFGRVKNQSNALIRSLAFNLIVRERIKTTEAKAKELRPFIEKLVTLAKKGGLSACKVVSSRLSNRKKETRKLFDVIVPRYADKKGGYTRVLKLGSRKSDGAKMAIVEFV